MLRGLGLALTIAAAAAFLGAHYGAPAMLFALLIGMAFNFLAEESHIRPGVDFAASTCLRLGVALLGVRLTWSDFAALGPVPVIAVIGLVALTIGVGVALARLMGQNARLGLLTGGSVAICGASAALALASVLPRDGRLERDTLFTVVAVTTLSTIAMVAYPLLFAALSATDAQTGMLIGATIHDVAQVVGAGYSVSQEAGDTAVMVKLMRVALLPVVLIAVIVATANGRAESGRIRLPWFLVAFIVLAIVNSLGLIPAPVAETAETASRILLITAIAALGVKTALKQMADLGGGYIVLVVAETAILLGMAIVIAKLFLL
ncbi:MULTISPECIES: putative sulfate exporter family transporter [unclassified Roseitalea]|uniref:YeiH family protein n=1 Tax=unclassified Roseitalea TaxID=2639107 RepID=UPI00273E543B|nr:MULTISPECIES: putative sulfate exporter family transporter [unclassified Roseitalea]